MGHGFPDSFEFPDLSRLNARLTDRHLLGLVFEGKVFVDPIARALALGLVRTIDSAVRAYERARVQMARSIAGGRRLGLFLEGVSEMEVAITALYRALRIAERVVESEATIINKDWIPSEGDRERLRSMRNAIDHVEGPIADGRCWQGESLFLEVTNADLRISEGGGELVIGQASLGEWVQKLHILAAELVREPNAWTPRGQPG
jgi:hypothetical protein